MAAIRFTPEQLAIEATNLCVQIGCRPDFSNCWVVRRIEQVSPLPFDDGAGVVAHFEKAGAAIAWLKELRHRQILAEARANGFIVTAAELR